MPVATIPPSEALPAAHCFVSVARGRKIRTIRLRLGVLRAGAAALGLMITWLVGSSLYLVFHDDLVAALMAREAATQYAYEDRIAALRGQVEREASLKLVGQTTLEAKLRDLGERANALETRASLLAEIGARLGTPVADRGLSGSPTMTTSPTPAGVDNPVTSGLRPSAAHDNAARLAPGKPHPEVEGRAATPDDAFRTSAADGPSFAIRLASVEERLERIDAGQYRSLAAVGDAARQKSSALRAAIQSAGLSPERLVGKGPAPAVGGPYVPLDPSVTNSSFGKAFDAMQADLSTAGQLVQALPHIPFATPMKGALEITSPFGARLDPFLGRAAMHTGVDLAEGYGTEVRATAAGRVVTAGTVGGYGTMIEIDHGHGLSTRYAHLSGVEVSVGRTVEKGEVIGEVGATGRATGPHLHYETRIDGEPVDPIRFLNAGLRLASLQAAL